eukprot:scaffold34664_cov240-Amphora_coffeaeformis.AAC.5
MSDARRAREPDKMQRGVLCTRICDAWMMWPLLGYLFAYYTSIYLNANNNERQPRSSSSF